MRNNITAPCFVAARHPGIGATGMVETIENLVTHLDGSRQPKAIVWAHNSHLGDARATEMSHYGEVNVGQLVRERFGKDAVLIGFTTHHGTVTAASDWGAPTGAQKRAASATRQLRRVVSRDWFASILDRFAGCRPDRRPPT